MTAGWRYHALRVLDRTWLHRDLPLSDVSISPALSGPGSMAAVLDPDTMALKLPDGTPLLASWRDLIVAEASDEVRFAGILVNSEFTGASWRLDIAGISAWPQGQPQAATLTYGALPSTSSPAPVPQLGADPVRIVRDLWAQLQALPDADLGVTFGGDAFSGYRLATWNNVPNQYDYHPDASTTVTIEPASGTKSLDELKTYDIVKVTVAGTGFSRTTKAHLDTPPAGWVDKSGAFWTHHVYDYENPDIGQKINDYAASTPFDYVEHAAWTDTDKSDVDLRIDIGSPRIGRRQLGLRFVEGENISDLVTVTADGEDWANGILAVGAGDGADQLRETVTVRDGHVRRVRVVTAAQIADRAQLRAVATAELNRVNKLTDIQSFTVREHPHAPYGSYSVGDDVLVQVTTGWAAGTSLWVRITGLTYQPDSSTVQITCARSDSFSYGSVTTT